MEYSNITIEDCIDMADKKNMSTIINKGKVEGFIKETKEVQVCYLEVLPENLTY